MTKRKSKAKRKSKRNSKHKRNNKAKIKKPAEPTQDAPPAVPDDSTTPGGKEIEPAASMAVRFKTQAKSIRDYLCSIENQENHPGLSHVYDLRRHFIANLTETAEQELKDCPNFGDLTRLSGANCIAGLSGLAGHCEHAAELLEAPETRQ